MASKPSHRLKFERAQYHLKQLKLDVLHWRETCGYATRWEPDSGDPIHSIVKASIQSQPDDQLSLVVGDVVQNLRASLDNLVYALAWVNSGYLTQQKAKSCQFTIVGGDDAQVAAKNFANTAGKDLALVSPEARTIIEGLQPFKVGVACHAWPLWQLNELAKIDRHRIMHVVAAMPNSFSIEPKPGKHYPPATGPGHTTLFRGFFMQGSARIARLPVVAEAGEANMEVNATLGIAFIEPDLPFYGKDVIELLTDISHFVVKRVFPPLEALL